MTSEAWRSGSQVVNQKHATHQMLRLPTRRFAGIAYVRTMRDKFP